MYWTWKHNFMTVDILLLQHGIVCVCFSERFRMLLDNLWACVETQQRASENQLISSESPSNLLAYFIVYKCLQIWLVFVIIFHQLIILHVFLNNFRVQSQESFTLYFPKCIARSSELHIPLYISQHCWIPQLSYANGWQLCTVTPSSTTHNYQASSTSAVEEFQKANRQSRKAQKIV